MTAMDKAIEIVAQIRKEIEYNTQPSFVNGMVKQIALNQIETIISELDSAFKQLSLRPTSRIIFWQNVKNVIIENY